MARSIGTLTLDLVMKTGGLSTGAAKAKREVSDLQKSFVTMGKAAGIAAGAFVGTALIAGMAAVIRETKEAQQEQTQLATVLKSTGQAAGYTQASLNDMADALEKATAIDGGDITKAQTALLAFTNIAGKQFPEALQAAADMSARTGMSIQQTSELIGRALDVPSQGMAALSKQGFRFSEEQKKVIKALEDTGQVAKAQDIVLKELQKTYGGAAEAARNTLPGAFAALQNSIKNVLTGGDSSFQGATDAVNQLANTLNDPQVQAGISSLVSGFAKIASGAVIATAKVAEFVAEIPAFAQWAASDFFFSVPEDVTKAMYELDRAQRILGDERVKRAKELADVEVREAARIIGVNSSFLQQYRELSAVVDKFNKTKATERDAQIAAATASAEMQKQAQVEAKQRIADDKAADAYKKRQEEIASIMKDLQEKLMQEGLSWDALTLKKLKSLDATEKTIVAAKRQIESIKVLQEINADDFGMTGGDGSSVRIDALYKEFATETELEQLRYDDKRAKFQEYADLSVMDEKERLAGLQLLQDEHNKILEMQNKNSWKNRKDDIQSTLGTISTLMNSENKKAFNIGKAAAIANALIATQEGAIKAYSAMSGIPVVGPALGAAAAAAIVAAGAMNVAAIKSTSFGGGGGVASGGMSNTQGLNAMNTPVQNAPTQRTNVTLVGDFFSREGVINMLNAAQKDGFSITGQ